MSIVSDRQYMTLFVLIHSHTEQHSIRGEKLPASQLYERYLSLCNDPMPYDVFKRNACKVICRTTREDLPWLRLLPLPKKMNLQLFAFNNVIRDINVDRYPLRKLYDEYQRIYGDSPSYESFKVDIREVLLNHGGGEDGINFWRLRNDSVSA